MPRKVVFPRAGQIWETVRDCEVPRPAIVVPKGQLLWRSARLRQGERVRILALDDPKPLQIRFQPVGYQQPHESIAPHGLPYELCMRTARTVPVVGDQTGYFNELFRLVEDVA